MTAYLEVTHIEHIVTLRFDRQEAHNALNLATMRRFHDVVQDLQNQPELRAVIITGAGERAFCSGGDLTELANYPDEAHARDFISVMGDALLMLERLPVPVIAAVNGYALGGGSEIALACDLRIVDETVRMGMVQVQMALTPGWGAGQRLLRLVGYSRAMQLLLDGRILQAGDLRQLGLANEVVATGTAYDEALSLARRIADRPPRVVRAIKALLQAGLTQTYDDALMTERDGFPALWADQPHLDAVAAFLARQQNKT